MKELYHGSNNRGIKRLEPQQSTHGKYVYATPYKELAIIFSAKCGDDFTYALFRNNKDEPWTIVERIPYAFNTMFNNSSSIYTLNDKTFKDIHTGFSELVSPVGVDTINEEYIENVYEKIKELKKEGKVKLYTYPNKPDIIPLDNSDLIGRLLKQLKRQNKPITKASFARLILLHPNLIDKINEKMKELNINEKPYQKEDLIELFENAVIKQYVYPHNEQYLESIISSISQIYKELVPSLKEKMSFIDKPKKEKISLLINKFSKYHPDIPNNIMLQLKDYLLKDEHPTDEIIKKLLEFSNKLSQAKMLINTPINQEVLDNSIILIGPMGTGKSTISKKLSEITGLPRISLDNKEQLMDYYKYRGNFENFKEFEFYLTCSVLTSLKEPTIIDFGAGHSIYENQIMLFEIKKLITQFKNVELILPSENKEESLRILDERINNRKDNHNIHSINKHFIENSSNYELATDIHYTHEKKPDEISYLILKSIKEREESKIKL